MPSRRDTLRGLGSLGVAGLAATAGCLDTGPGSYDGVTPGDDADTDWPHPRHDARATGYAPDAAAPRTGATVSWRRDTFLPRPPVVADGLVLSTAAGVGVTAYDVSSGEERWSYEPGEHPTVGAPAVHDGVAYVPMREGLTAVRLADGEELWRGPPATPEATPVVTDDGDYVFGGGEDGHVYQLDPATGEVTWETDVFGTVRTLSLKRFLFVGTAGGEVYAFGDRFDPQEAWRLRFGGIVEAVTAHSNGPTVALFGGPLTNLTDNAGVGSVQWTAPAGRANTAPVLVGSWLVSAGYDILSTTRGYDGRRGWSINGGSTAVTRSPPATRCISVTPTVSTPSRCRAASALAATAWTLADGRSRWVAPSALSRSRQGRSLRPSAAATNTRSSSSTRPTTDVAT